MAQLDASLIGGYQPIQPPDPVNQLTKYLQLQSLQGQAQLQQQTIQTHQNALQRQAGLQDAYKSFTPGMKLEDQAAALTQRGYGQEGLAILDKASGINKDNASAAKSNAEADIQRMNARGQLASAVATKPNLSYADVEQLRQRAQQAGIAGPNDFADIPPTATPDQLRQYFTQYGQGSITAAQQASQKLDQARLAETTRHDQSTEAVARGQLGVSQGHLAVSRQAEARQASQGAASVAQGKVPAGYRPTADGQGLEAIPGGPADPNVQSNKPLTGEQGKALQFGNRMQSANSIISSLEKQGEVSGGRVKESIANIPGGTALGNVFSSEKQQQYGQAKQNFILAALRDESGAAIGSDEYTKYEKAFFPQANEPDSVIRQKAAARDEIVRTMGQKTGGRPIVDAPQRRASDAGIPDDIKAIMKAHGITGAN